MGGETLEASLKVTNLFDKYYFLTTVEMAAAAGERSAGTSAGMGTHREEKILEAARHGKSGSGRKCGKADGIPSPVIEKILAREPDLRVMRRPPGDRNRAAVRRVENLDTCRNGKIEASISERILSANIQIGCQLPVQQGVRSPVRAMEQRPLPGQIAAGRILSAKVQIGCQLPVQQGVRSPARAMEHRRLPGPIAAGRILGAQSHAQASRGAIVERCRHALHHDQRTILETRDFARDKIDQV